MAVIWQKTLAGRNYQVRSAGNSRRLYTDGVFHSQYNPERALAGGIWDLLMFPAFFLEPGKIKRVLVLGVGGGAVIQQIHRYIAPQAITGIELNPVHIDIARRFFGITKKLAILECAEAKSWLSHYRGKPFDLIIDDLFMEEKGEPVRAIDADAGWFALLKKNLSQQGVLVLNSVGTRELKRSAYFKETVVRENLAHAFLFKIDNYANSIGAFTNSTSSIKTLRQNIQDTPGLGQNLALKFEVRVLN